MAIIQPLSQSAHEYFGPRTEAAGLVVEHAPDGQTVEDPADGGQVLLDRGLGHPLAGLLDMGGDRDGLDLVELESTL